MADRVISFVARIYPAWLRRFLFSFLYSIYIHLTRLKSIVLQFRMPVFLVCGIDKELSKPIRFLFVGHGVFPLFISDLLFDSDPSVDQVGNVFVWRLNSLHQFSGGVDAVLVSCDCFFQRWLKKFQFVIIPHMVDMVLDVPDSMGVFYQQLPNSAKSDVRKVRKYGYDFEVSSDVNQLKMFYDNMYVPLIRNRVRKGLVFIPPFSFYKVLYEIGYQLFLVKDNSDSYVSGCFFYVHDDVLFTRDFGVLDGCEELIRKGAENALYYFSIVHAKRLGLNRVDFGYCRPVLTDGIYQYKKKWGMNIRKPQEHFFPEVYGLKIVDTSSVLTDFFKENAFFAFDEEGNLVKFGR